MQRIEPACPVGGDLSGCTEIDLDFFYIAGTEDTEKGVWCRKEKRPGHKVPQGA
jgi:hypothetical protein